MRLGAVCALLVLAACSRANGSNAAAAGSRATAGEAVTAGSVAFVGVSVIPMDGERVLPNQTVVVRDGKIVSVEPAATASVPAGAVRIDGRGKFLMPGLAEMHAHVAGAQAANSEQVNRDIFLLYVANGITTIRAMLGAPNQLVLRDRLQSGEILGPTMYVSAPSLNGQSAPDPATAERLVQEHKTAGYDFLKIHPGPSREAYDAIVRTARAVGITWAGHVPQAVGVRHALASGQSTIDHLDGYLAAAVPDSLTPRVLRGAVPMRDLIGAVEESRFSGLARATRDAGTWSVPTMYLWESFSSPATPEELAALPEMRYASPQWIRQWQNQKRQMIRNEEQAGITAELAQRHFALRRSMLKSLADAGAKIMLGSDSPQMFNVPGFSIHREMGVMVGAGLTPYQVLESGTRNVARYVAEDLRLDGAFGTVAVGNRADLVLLDGNPLDDVSRAALPAGVMLRGRWLPKAQLDSALEEMVRRN